MASDQASLNKGFHMQAKDDGIDKECRRDDGVQQTRNDNDSQLRRAI
jgi:hypothetical protein